MKTTFVKTTVNSFNKFIQHLKESLATSKQRVCLIDMKTGQRTFVTGASLFDYADSLIEKGNSISEIVESEREIYFR